MKTPLRTLALSLAALTTAVSTSCADGSKPQRGPLVEAPSQRGPRAEAPPPPPLVQPLPDLPGQGHRDDGPPPNQPLPPPVPVPPPGTSGLCQAFYQGSFTQHRSSATLAIQADDFVLHGNGLDYHGSGTCEEASADSASFQFTLDDDARYVFSGTIQARGDGTAVVNANEFKAGQLIDRLVLSGAVGGN